MAIPVHFERQDSNGEPVFSPGKVGEDEAGALCAALGLDEGAR